MTLLKPLEIVMKSLTYQFLLQMWIFWATAFSY